MTQNLIELGITSSATDTETLTAQAMAWVKALLPQQKGPVRAPINRTHYVIKEHGRAYILCTNCCNLNGMDIPPPLRILALQANMSYVLNCNTGQVEMAETRHHEVVCSQCGHSSN